MRIPPTFPGERRADMVLSSSIEEITEKAARREDLGAVYDELVGRIAERWGRVELLPLRREVRRILGCAKVRAVGEAVERLADAGVLVEETPGAWTAASVAGEA